MPPDGKSTSEGRTDLDAALHKQPGRSRNLGISDLLSERLDDLCALVNRDGTLPATIYRQDLVAALVALAPEDVEGLEKLLADYYALKVRDALVGAAKDAKIIQLRPRKPGRRTF